MCTVRGWILEGQCGMIVSFHECGMMMCSCVVSNNSFVCLLWPRCSCPLLLDSPPVPCDKDPAHLPGSMWLLVLMLTLMQSSWTLEASQWGIVEIWLACRHVSGRLSYGNSHMPSFIGKGSWTLYKRRKWTGCKSACIDSFLSALDSGCDVTGYFNCPPLWLPHNNGLEPRIVSQIESLL